jgi:transketolase
MTKAEAVQDDSAGRINPYVSRRISALDDWARKIRIDILEMCYGVGPERKAHPGGALSAVEIVTALYFDIMRIKPEEPSWADRDRFILSKGHACPVLYAALANRGYFDKAFYRELRRIGGRLQGHPDMRKTPGVDMTTGSLGHGLAAGAGIAASGKIDKRDFQVFVLLGDGEVQEGLVWESAMAAPRLGLDNLTAVVDVNRLQSGGAVDDILCLTPLREKWMSFGWNPIEIDGHDMGEVLNALDLALAAKGSPTVILAKTIKGKGVEFMENDNAWHQKTPSEEQYKTAIEALKAGGAA